VEKSKTYTNFYESIKEANMRINNTLVLYDGDPYFVLAVGDHNPDGVFRVYLDPLPTEPNELMAHQMYSIPYTWHDEPGMSRGEKMDKWLDTNDGKKSKVIRKMMNSPKFNKFRPFPLGMQNIDGGVSFIERKPTRFTQQGIMDNMVSVDPIVFQKAERQRFQTSRSFTFYGYEMYNTIKGIYPTADECFARFESGDVGNSAVAFDRNFAFVQGPLSLLYLAYKQDIVGFLPSVADREVRLGREFQHLKEVVAELGVFDKIS
jgi:hypothetical protein